MQKRTRIIVLLATGLFGLIGVSVAQAAGMRGECRVFVGENCTILP